MWQDTATGIYLNQCRLQQLLQLSSHHVMHMLQDTCSLEKKIRALRKKMYKNTIDASKDLIDRKFKLGINAFAFN